MNERIKREIYRYLQAGDAQSDELDSAICRASSLAETAVRVRYVTDILPCEPDENGVTVGGYFFAGHSLARNLQGCTRTALLAVTLGSTCDLLLRQEGARGALPVAVMQAVLTVRIEQACDEVQAALQATLPDGCVLNNRFSLGYGDTLLTDQKAFFSLLPITKQTGITLTDGCLMIPSKSVTAFSGIIEKG